MGELCTQEWAETSSKPFTVFGEALPMWGWLWGWRVHMLTDCMRTQPMLQVARTPVLGHACESLSVICSHSLLSE